MTVLVLAGALGGVWYLAPLGAADTDPAVSPVQFTACGTHTWNVPAGVSAVTLDVFGGSGGSSSALTGGTPGPGGLGGEATGTIAVQPGEVLQVNVGCAGSDASGHTPGTGGGGGDNDANGGNGVLGANVPIFTATGGGGGASDIRQGGTTLANRVVVGGGGGSGGDAGTSGTGAAGGGGGFPNGQDGATSGGISPGCVGGSGGTQSSGGAGGTTNANCDIAGTPATGPSGANGVSNGTTGFGSGAGGGGFNGGGSGATTSDDPGVTGGGAGGGGANFFAPTVSGQSSNTGVRAGDGLVVISFTSTAAVAPQPVTVVPRFTG